MKKFKKLLAGIMTLAMLVTMLPATVLADDETPITTPAPKTIEVKLGDTPAKNGANFMAAVDAADNGDTIVLPAGTYYLKDNSQNDILGKSVTIIGAGTGDDGTIITGNKYGFRVDGYRATGEKRVQVTIKNMKIASASHPIYAKNDIDLYLENMVLTGSSTTAILLDSTNKISEVYYNDVRTVVNAKNVTIDEGAEVLLNASPLSHIGATQDYTTYAEFTFEDCTNILAKNCKPQHSIAGQDNMFVNGTNISPSVASVAKIGGIKYETLTDAIAAANVKKGDITIKLLADCAEDVTIVQQEGVNITVDGNGNNYSGTVDIHGSSRHTGQEFLKFKNVNFVTTEAAHDFFYSWVTKAPNDGSPESKAYDDARKYAHNVIVEDCSFTATGDALNSAFGLRIRQGYNITIQNCTATGLSTLMWETGGNNIVVDNVDVENCGNGISVATCSLVTVKNSTFETTDKEGFGIRADGTGACVLNVENCEIKAFAPVLVRNFEKQNTGPYTVNISGQNTMDAKNDAGYQVVFNNKNGYGSEMPLEVPTGAYVYSNSPGNALKVYPENSALTTDIAEQSFVVGVPTEFTFTTVAAKDAGKMVIGTSNFSNADAIEKLEYYETADGTWHDLNGNFGPATGFPMDNATSKFRVTFKTAGEYTFTASMKAVENDATLCSVNVAFEVVEPAPEPTPEPPVSSDRPNRRPAKKTEVASNSPKVETGKEDDAFGTITVEEKTMVLTIGKPDYTLDGVYMVNDVAPIIRESRTFLPIRVVAETLGATVTWNEAEQTVTIVEGDTTIVIYIGQAFALVNGNPVQLDAPAFIANDRTYLPVRFVAENLGATVTWDAETQTVTIVGKI